MLNQIKARPSTLCRSLKLAGAVALLGGALAVPPSPAVQPYTNDANTVLLDHLDGGTPGSLYSYFSASAPCGGQYPTTSAAYSFVTGHNGLNTALRLCHQNGPPEPGGSVLRYNSQLLSQPNGTLEFWVNLSDYGTGLALVDQGPYYGSCAGWTFGMGIGTNGVLTAGAWAAFNLSSGTNLVPLNKWTHLAVSWGSTGAKLYMDGNLVGTDANTGMPASGFGGNVMFRIGTHLVGVCSLIDEIRISNVQRTSFNVPTSAPLSNMKTYAGFAITGVPGTPCRVDYCPAFGATNTWVTLTNFTLPSSPYTFIDYGSPSNTNRFYRAILNP